MADSKLDQRKSKGGNEKGQRIDIRMLSLYVLVEKKTETSETRRKMGITERNKNIRERRQGTLSIIA